MLVRALLLLGLFGFFSGVEGCDIKWPNGTDVALHWWQCDNGPIKVYNITTFFPNGTFEYPIHLNGKILIWADLDNPTYTFSEPNLRASANIWSWGTFGGGCGWSTVPTFGLTQNLDACKYGVKCPVYPGRQWISVLFDISEFQPIVNLLTDDAPYQLQLLLSDKTQGVSVCGMAQARCFTT